MDSMNPKSYDLLKSVPTLGYVMNADLLFNLNLLT